ncbi:MAG: DinB family protein [Pseudonocardiaceae bacterium]
MPSDSLGSRVPVTAADVDDAVQLAIATVSEAPSTNWNAQAASLNWTCWETIEHLANALFFYATQLATTATANKVVPFACTPQRPNGPKNMIFADRATGPTGLLQVLNACSALLVAAVHTSPPHIRAHHVFGAADPEGFAAMGVVETLVHTHDVAEGIGLIWTPPADLCDRVLARLFPHAPANTTRWHTLLWATGRAELPDRPRLTTWRWYGSPPATKTAGTTTT